MSSLPEPGGVTDQILAVIGAKHAYPMTTRDVIRKAGGDPDDKKVRAEYASAMYRLHNNRYVHCAGKTTWKVGWQKPAEYRWQITTLGKLRILEIDDARARIADEQRIALALAGAVEASPRLSKEARVTYARALRDDGVTPADIGRVFGEKTGRIIASETPVRKPGRRVPFGPGHPMFGKVAGYLSDESGLSQDEIMVLWTIMRDLGIMVSLPPNWRNETERLARVEPDTIQ